MRSSSTTPRRSTSVSERSSDTPPPRRGPRGVWGDGQSPQEQGGSGGDRPPGAALFDMDGLLFDSEQLWLEAETAVMARLSADWTTADQAQLLGCSLDR